MDGDATISVDDFNRLRADNEVWRKEGEALRVENEVFRAENQSLRSELRQVKEQLDWLKRQVFGQKSERLADLPGDYPDLPGLSLSEEKEESDPEKIEIPEHKRRKNSGGKGEHKLVIPDDLERVVEVVDLPPEEKIDPETGEWLVEIGRDAVEKLACRPEQYYVKRFEYPKYAKVGDALQGVVQAPAPPCVIEGSKFDASFMADLTVEKFGFHMPLNRFQERLSLVGVMVSRQTLCSMLIKLGEAVLPIYHLMIRKIFAGGTLFTDDTPVKLIVNGKGKTQTARMWIYLAGKPNAPPYHVYQFTEDWSHDHPKKFLKDFKGTFHADAYEAYEELDSDREDVTWAACWSHARRNFENALAGGRSEFLLEVLRTIKWLFLYERVAWANSAEKRLEIRREKERPLVEGLFKLLHEKLSSPELLPKSKLAQAIKYMLVRKKNFMVYLDDPDVRMDNNPAERGLRKVVLGKKNWLFIGSPRAGESAAALYSLVQTCRAMKVNPKTYLEDVYTRLLDHPAKRLDEFLPDNWLRLEIEKAKREAESAD